MDRWHQQESAGIEHSTGGASERLVARRKHADRRLRVTCGEGDLFVRSAFGGYAIEDLRSCTPHSLHDNRQDQEIPAYGRA
jgi:hypothetical protein